jgi:hypothetical protein
MMTGIRPCADAVRPSIRSSASRIQFMPGL